MRALCLETELEKRKKKRDVGRSLSVPGQSVVAPSFPFSSDALLL